MKLNDVMEFDHVVMVRDDGTVTDGPAGVYAPELFDGELMGEGWELLDGYSGQYRYSGPIMHSSEYIGGSMERDILAEPGMYVALVDYPSDDGEPDGWAVARRTGIEGIDSRGVVELSPNDPRATVCGGCGRGWDDTVSTSVTPAPAGRCPFEYDH